MGDVLLGALPSVGVLGRMLFVAVLLAIVFIGERYDRSPTDAWYWLAVILIQMAAVRLADFSTIQLGINRLEVVGALALLLVTTMVVARSDETHLFSTLQLERPGTAAKPLADVAHWLGMIVASTLGAAGADLCAITFHVGTLASALILTAMILILLQLQRRSRPNRLHAFWLTTILVRADGVSIGDLLVRGDHLHLGLPLSTLLTALVTIAMLAFWRPPTAHV
ncbi:MAG: hypothetical protein JOY81_12080 [Alphaproteobacteria bacterium]|nr:hypothetical protein [Alphaproteobacteria bacterium]